MKICSVDIGTNSVLCLLSKIDAVGRLTPLEFRAETTRLGKSLRKNDVLLKSAQDKTILSINIFLSKIQADKYIFAGTSALREANNSHEFLKKFHNQTGHIIKILSEHDEAQLAFDSVNHFLNPIPNKAIICDIGGGSTEFILCENKKIKNIISIPIGAVNLTERFSNVSKMESFIKSELEEKLDIPIGSRLISVGGTVTTLGAILKKLKHYDADKVHGESVSFEQVASVFNKLNSLTLNQRKKLISFAPKRADIIVAGLCILKTIMEVFKIKKFKICEKGLVYGLAIRYAYSRCPSS